MLVYRRVTEFEPEAMMGWAVGFLMIFRNSRGENSQVPAVNLPGCKALGDDG